MTQATDPQPALTHACPFCGADRGQPCRTLRGRGTDRRSPHLQRVALVDEWVRQRQDRRRDTEQALCCECGSLRTCKRPRNYVAERDDHQTWHRMVGDLKCEACGRVTRHALLRSGEYRDTAENYQRMALGGEPQDRLDDVDRARREFRMGLPRNPYLHHRYWVPEARKAWADGSKSVTALCGEPMRLNVDPDGPSRDGSDPLDLIEPAEDHDVEYEDPGTGLWWVDMDCVDCLRVANGNRLKNQRRELLSQLLEASALVERMDAVQVAELREHVERLMSNIGGTNSG